MTAELTPRQQAAHDKQERREQAARRLAAALITHGDEGRGASVLDEWYAAQRPDIAAAFLARAKMLMDVIGLDVAEKRPSKAVQDEFTRQRRLNEGRCPTHGLKLMPKLGYDALACPRKKCGFITSARKAKAR